MAEKWNGIPRDKINWHPTINYEKCSGCMTCVENCSNKVYSKKAGKPVVSKPNNCLVGCTGCKKRCPKKAISFPPKSYLLSLTKIKDFKTCCK